MPNSVSIFANVSRGRVSDAYEFIHNVTMFQGVRDSIFYYYHKFEI